MYNSDTMPKFGNEVPQVVSIKGYPDDLYWFLRERAEINGRSLTKEIIWILREVKAQADKAQVKTNGL